MNSPVSNPYAGSQLPTCVPACHYSDSHFISGLGVVLLIFGGGDLSPFRSHDDRAGAARYRTLVRLKSAAVSIRAESRYAVIAN